MAGENRPSRWSPTPTATAEPISHAAPPAAGENLLITVVDENDVPVPSSLIFLQSSTGVFQLKCETDFVGHCSFQGLVAGSYQLHVEKEGFYALSPTAVQLGQTLAVDAKLSHLQEAREVVNVVESSPGIDPAQTASTEQQRAPSLSRRALSSRNL